MSDNAFALLKRLAASVVVVLGVSFLVFCLARIIPGDPARVALGPSASAAQIDALRSEMGFDQPIFVQYWRFLVNAVQLDFGRSLYTGRPVSLDISTALPATIELVIFASFYVVILGGLAGIVSAHFKDRLPDNLARIFSLIVVAIPNFVWALLLMLVFSYWLRITPFAGRLSDGFAAPAHITGLYTVDAVLTGNFRTFLDALSHLVLPSVTLSLGGIAVISRLTRTNMLDVYARPYIEFARAYHFPGPSIAFKWALRPASIPILMVLGMQIVTMIGGAFIVESIFGWPGIAKYGVNAILRKDLNAIVAVVTVIAVFFVAMNLLIDFIVTIVDPKLKAGGV